MTVATLTKRHWLPKKGQWLGEAAQPVPEPPPQRFIAGTPCAVDPVNGIPLERPAGRVRSRGRGRGLLGRRARLLDIPDQQ